MKYLVSYLIVAGFFTPSLSYGAPRSLPVHLFLVRAKMVQNSYSTLGRAWAAKMKIKLYKEVLKGHYGDVDEVFVPVIEDGTGRLQTFQKEFSETQSTLEAIALKAPGAYLIWDSKDKTIGAFRLEVPSAEASASVYAKDEVDAAVVNGQVFNSALSNELSQVKVLPVIFGETLKDGPFRYSYLLRPFSPDNIPFSRVHPLSEILESNIDLKWRQDYLELFGKKVAQLNYRFGIYPSLNPQSIDLELDPKTNEIKNFFIRSSKNVTVDNFIRITQKAPTLHTGRRTPQINRYHYYNPSLAQPGENIATFTADSILIPGIEKTEAIRIFLKSYIKTIKEVTGVYTDISGGRAEVDSKWEENQVRGFLANAFQNIYTEVVDSKRPVFNEKPIGSRPLLLSEFKRRYESSDVAILDYTKSSFLGFHNFGLAWKNMSEELGFTYDPVSKNIFAYDLKTGKVLAIAYDIKQDTRFTAESTLRETITFKDLLDRYILGFKLTVL